MGSVPYGQHFGHAAVLAPTGVLLAWRSAHLRRSRQGFLFGCGRQQSQFPQNMADACFSA